LIAPDIDRLLHSHVRRGDAIGIVADLSRLTIRAVAAQDDTAAFLVRRGQRVELCLPGRPDTHMTGRVIDVFRTGSRQLPSAALGYAAGGRLAIDPRDPKGTRTTEPFRTILLAPETARRLRPGQRVVARFALPPKPLAAQAWRGLLRLLQRRFHV
jgi:putative peptide zinc metalloprotease protein